MSNFESTFFSLVSTRADRQRVLKYLIENKIRLHCKITDSDYVYIEPTRIRDGILYGESTSTIQILSEISVVVSFALTHERFFMKTVLNQTQVGRPHVTLDFDRELFKLQRRDLYRIPLPKQTNAQVFIDHMGNERIQKYFSILNLSGGGFALEFGIGEDCPFEKGLDVRGVLKVSGLNKEFSASVTYVRSIGTRGSGLLRVGFQFQDFRSHDKEEIVQTVMDLHRDLYTPFKLGTR